LEQNKGEFGWKGVSIWGICFGPMIKYNKESLRALSSVGVGNVLSSVVYVVGFVGFEKNGSEMTRVQLLRVRDVSVLSVDFRVSGSFGEADVRVSEFVSVGSDRLECEIAFGSVSDVSVLGVVSEHGEVDVRGRRKNTF
jgi:hypothetical protein